MLIRKEQFDSFSGAAVHNFENEMIEHLRRFSPRISRIVGDQGLLDEIRLGIQRAESYGFTNRGPARFYIESMFALGTGFDTDPLLPWAGEILRGRVPEDQMARADGLFRAADRYLTEVAGPDNEYALDALSRIRTLRKEDFRGFGSNYHERIIAELRRMYPRKAAYAGEAGLRSLIQEGFTASRECAITSEFGVTLILGMMYGFGHGIIGDPLYPWVAATLNHALVPNPNDRAERLFDKLKVYVDGIAEHLMGGHAQKQTD